MLNALIICFVVALGLGWALLRTRQALGAAEGERKALAQELVSVQRENSELRDGASLALAEASTQRLRAVDAELKAAKARERMEAAAREFAAQKIPLAPADTLAWMQEIAGKLTWEEA